MKIEIIIGTGIGFFAECDGDVKPQKDDVVKPTAVSGESCWQKIMPRNPTVSSQAAPEKVSGSQLKSRVASCRRNQFR